MFWKKDNIDDEIKSLDLPGDSLKPLEGAEGDPNNWNPSALPGQSGQIGQPYPYGQGQTQYGQGSQGFGQGAVPQVPQGLQGQTPASANAPSTDFTTQPLGGYNQKYGNEFFSSGNSGQGSAGSFASAAGAHNQDILLISKEIEVVSSKLDAVQSSLDSLNQRLKSIERLAYGEQEQQSRKKYW